MRFTGGGQGKRLMAVGPAESAEWEAVARLLFCHLPAEQRAARLANALRLFHSGEIERDGILAAHFQGELCAALVCIPLRGAGALVWPPQALPGPTKTLAEDQLVEHGLAWLRRRGAKIAQALLPSQEEQLAGPLKRHGFRHVTTLLYLRRPLTDHDAAGLNDDPLTYQVYEDDPATFEETLTRTYEGTLDCPELNGVRDVAEIIEGHKAQSNWQPERWWLARQEGRPVGVLLLAEAPEWQAWDVSYLGVVPEARRRGIGRLLTARAVRQAQAAGLSYLTLAVDARNEPARRLYAHLGFESFDRREVYLFFFKEANRALPE
jgi:mycothiol synthase